MTKFWVDDLDTMFDGWDGVSYNGASIDGIFDDAYRGLNTASGEIETSAPALQVKSSDVTGIAHGSTITVNAITYKVTGIEPDGTGVTVLRLARSGT
jgi:hypothetical protein